MHIKDLGHLIDITNEYQKAGTITDNVNAVLSVSFKNLTASEILARTATLGLSDAQKFEIINLYATDQANYKTVASITALSASQAATTSTTASLSAAFKGLWATLMANPVLLVVAGAGALAGVLSTINHLEDKLAEATKSSAMEAQTASKSIDEYAQKYKTLHDELTDANTTEERQAEIKNELLSLQTKINEAYGDEYGRINLVTDAYKDQTDTIKNLNKELAKQWLADNNKGIELATRKMEKENPYILGSSVSAYSEAGQAIHKIADNYKDRGITAEMDETSGTYTIRLKANVEDADKVIDDFKRDIYDLKKRFQDSPLIDEVLNTSNTCLLYTSFHQPVSRVLIFEICLLPVGSLQTV